jgi:Ca2+-binding RTX toxin-like protein
MLPGPARRLRRLGWLLAAMVVATLVPILAAPASAASVNLVISEVDYDQPSTDTAEFVEIYNMARTSVGLTNVAVVFFNAGDTPASEYLRVPLSGSIPPLGIVTIASGTLPFLMPGGSATFAFPGDGNQIQNGPDGLALINTATNFVFDAVAYEADIPSARIAGGPLINLGPNVGADDGVQPDFSLFRPTMDNDTDTAQDWRVWDSTPHGENCHVLGTTGNDQLADPSPTANVICGGPGDDGIVGLDGGDVLIGGAGGDTLLGCRGNDYLDGRAGLDAAGFYDTTVSTSGVVVDLAAGYGYNEAAGWDSIVFAGPAGAQISTIEQVQGSPYDDDITGDGQVNYLDGREGHDVVRGGDGHDKVRGNLGNDSLYGGNGDDRLLPGFGDDPVSDGGPGADTIEYSDIKGAGPGQTIDLTAMTSSGAFGTDGLASFVHVYGSDRDDVLTARFGGVGSWVIGFAGNDVLHGDDGDMQDFVRGAVGMDSCSFDVGDLVMECEVQL